MKEKCIPPADATHWLPGVAGLTLSLWIKADDISLAAKPTHAGGCWRAIDDAESIRQAMLPLNR